MNSLRLLTIALISFLSACVAPGPGPSELAAASYGSMPSESELRQALNAYGSENLIDPLSAMYFITGDPRKGWAKPNAFLVGHERDPAMFGWLVSVDINSKNRLGGYVGRRPYIFLYKDGRVYSATESHTSYGTPIECPYGYVSQ